MAPQSMITPATVLMVIPVSIAIQLLVNIKINNVLYHRQRDNEREREREIRERERERCQQVLQIKK